MEWKPCLGNGYTSNRYYNETPYHDSFGNLWKRSEHKFYFLGKQRTRARKYSFNYNKNKEKKAKE